MIIKYGTSEDAALVDGRNLPSWMAEGATAPVAAESADADSASDNEKEGDEE